MTALGTRSERRDDGATIVDLLDRLLDTGAVLSGDLMVSVAGIDLVWLGLRAVLSSVETARPGGDRAGQGGSASMQVAGPESSVQATARRPSVHAAARDGSRQIGCRHPTVRPDLDSETTSIRPEEDRGRGRARTTPGLVPAGRRPADRLDIASDDVGKGLIRLVLTVVELLRELMERQAIRRMDGGGLSEEEIDRLGRALERLAERMEDLKEMFGLNDEDLRLELGPLGDLL